MKEIEIKITGMVCGGCENRVKNALSTIEGVSSVEANYKTGIVTIISKEEIDTSIIENIIDDLGFEIQK